MRDPANACRIVSVDGHTFTLDRRRLMLKSPVFETLLSLPNDDEIRLSGKAETQAVLAELWKFCDDREEIEELQALPSDLLIDLLETMSKLEIAGTSHVSYALRSRRLEGPTALRCLEVAARHADHKLITHVARASVEPWVKESVVLPEDVLRLMVRSRHRHSDVQLLEAPSVGRLDSALRMLKVLEMSSRAIKLRIGSGLHSGCAGRFIERTQSIIDQYRAAVEDLQPLPQGLYVAIKATAQCDDHDCRRVLELHLGVSSVLLYACEVVVGI